RRRRVICSCDWSVVEVVASVVSGGGGGGGGGFCGGGVWHDRGGGFSLSLRSQDGIIVHEMFNGGVEMVSLYMRCSMEESRWYRYTRDVQRRSRDGIVVHEMFNGGVEMVSLYMRCSTEESRWYRCT
ncbi:hypothetical protein Tco_1424101, partial [Tanacetum coccineum]